MRDHRRVAHVEREHVVADEGGPEPDEVRDERCLTTADRSDEGDGLVAERHRARSDQREPSKCRGQGRTCEKKSRCQRTGGTRGSDETIEQPSVETRCRP